MNSVYHQAQFIKSVPNIDHAPMDSGIEIAFAGRSNAGKSSAINALTRQKALARTSKTPGRTQLLNFFAIDAQRRFVDLPGYGYAKVPPALKQQWKKMMQTYLTERQSLCGIILVMDIRRSLTEFDRQMIAWSEYNEKPLHMLLTKSDKLKFGAAKNALLKVQKELQETNITYSLQLYSAPNKVGIDEVHEVLDTWFHIGEELDLQDADH